MKEKNFSNVKISNEDKILIEKIIKNSKTLDKKIGDFFDSRISMRTESIKEAFIINGDLLSIINKKNSLVNDIKNDFYKINNQHNIDFIPLSYEKIKTRNTKHNFSIIERTAKNSNSIYIDADTKKALLNKKWQLDKRKTKKTKKEYDDALELVNKKIQSNLFLHVDETKKDIDLINNTINEKQINKYRYLYLIPIFFLMLTFVIGGVLLLI